MKINKAKKDALSEAYSQGYRLLALSFPDVPLDTGSLRHSGFVENHSRGDVISVDVGFGLTNVRNPKHGKATSTYAEDQHENTSYVHPRGGKDRFLVDPFDKIKSDMITQVVRKFVKGLGS